MLFQPGINIKINKTFSIFCTDSENVYTDSTSRFRHQVLSGHMWLAAAILDNAWSCFLSKWLPVNTTCFHVLYFSFPQLTVGSLRWEMCRASVPSYSSQHHPGPGPRTLVLGLWMHSVWMLPSRTVQQTTEDWAGLELRVPWGSIWVPWHRDDGQKSWNRMASPEWPGQANESEDLKSICGLRACGARSLQDTQSSADRSHVELSLFYL